MEGQGITCQREMTPIIIVIVIFRRRRCNNIVVVEVVIVMKEIIGMMGTVKIKTKAMVVILVGERQW